MSLTAGTSANLSPCTTLTIFRVSLCQVGDYIWGLLDNQRFYVKFQSACSNLPAKSTRESLSDWAERLVRSPSRSSPCGSVPDLCACRCQVSQSRFSLNPAGNPSFFRRLQLPSILVPPSLQTCSREGRRAGLWNISGFRLLSHGSAPQTYDFLFLGPQSCFRVCF